MAVLEGAGYRSSPRRTGETARALRRPKIGRSVERLECQRVSVAVTSSLESAGELLPATHALWCYRRPCGHQPLAVSGHVKGTAQPHPSSVSTRTTAVLAAGSLVIGAATAIVFRVSVVSPIEVAELPGADELFWEELQGTVAPLGVATAFANSTSSTLVVRDYSGSVSEFGGGRFFLSDPSGAQSSDFLLLTDPPAKVALPLLIPPGWSLNVRSVLASTQASYGWRMQVSGYWVD